MRFGLAWENVCLEGSKIPNNVLWKSLKYAVNVF